jgi:hypothetical protein
MEPAMPAGKLARQQQQHDFITRQELAGQRMRAIRSRPDPERRFNPAGLGIPEHPAKPATSHRLFEQAASRRVPPASDSALEERLISVSEKSNDLAHQYLERIIHSMFPATESLDENQFHFLMKRFGIKDSVTIEKIAGVGEKPDGRYDTVRLLALFAEAARDDCERKLAKQLHQCVRAVLANDKRRPLMPRQGRRNENQMLQPPKPPAVEGEKFLPGFYDTVNLPRYRIRTSAQS